MAAQAGDDAAQAGVLDDRIGPEGPARERVGPAAAPAAVAAAVGMRINQGMGCREPTGSGVSCGWMFGRGRGADDQIGPNMQRRQAGKWLALIVNTCKPGTRLLLLEQFQLAAGNNKDYAWPVLESVQVGPVLEIKHFVGLR